MAIHAHDSLGGAYTTYMCGHHHPRCSALAVRPLQPMTIHRIDLSTHHDIIGHKNSNNDSFFLVLMTNTCCIVCTLIVVCFVAKSVAPRWPYDNGGCHDRMMNNLHRRDSCSFPTFFGTVAATHHAYICPYLADMAQQSIRSMNCQANGLDVNNAHRHFITNFLVLII